MLVTGKRKHSAKRHKTKWMQTHYNKTTARDRSVLFLFAIRKARIQKNSSFQKQVLLAWSLIYKHNFSPDSYFILNNVIFSLKISPIFSKLA